MTSAMAAMWRTRTIDNLPVIENDNDALTAPIMRKPDAIDGAAIHKLVAETKGLDDNSMYCNLVQASHFADTAIVAEDEEGLAGFVTGYCPPNEPHAFFVWQVCVHPRMRGKKLAARMIKAILARPALDHITELQATITPDNKASWGLFKSVARDFGARLNDKPLFDKHRHFAGEHDTEFLVSIAPLRG